MSNKIYPIGIQNFEKIRKEGYFYIDKTALVYQLVKTGSYYFLSRPRRFGKSLLISTLEAYFQGKKELFTGLAIEKLEKDWIQYPIFHLDLNIGKYDAPDSLDKILNDHLGVAEGIPQCAETFLRSAEDHGRLYQVCLADGCHQVWQGQRVQRPEQSE